MDELDGMETMRRNKKSQSNDVFYSFVTAFITCAPRIQRRSYKIYFENNVKFS